MELTTENEMKALGLLISGELSAKEISEQLQMSYAAVLRVKKQHDDAMVSGQVHDIIAATEHTLDATCVEGMVTEINAVGMLERSVVATATALSNRIKHLTLSAESAGEVLSLVEAITKLNDSFFRDMRPNVNVHNTTITGDAAQVMYGDLLNDKPANYRS